jgi:Phosphodiester glycosidase
LPKYGAAKILFPGTHALLVLLLLSSAPARLKAGQTDIVTIDTVRPGVIHRTLRRYEGPWQIHVLEIDLRQHELAIESARALDRVRGRETTGSMTRRSSDSDEIAIAGLNADFFDLKTGETVNNQVNHGVIARALVPQLSEAGEYRGRRSQFAFTMDRRPLLDKFVFDGKIFWPGNQVTSVGGVNVVRARTEFVLYNAFNGELTPVDSLRRGTLELALREVGNRRDTILMVVNGRPTHGGGTTIPPHGMVLSTHRRQGLFDSLAVRPGDTVKVCLGFLPLRPRIRTLVGGIPRIVLDGKNVAGLPQFLEGAGSEFSSRRHPRSGVGFSSDSSTVYFVTVDGRQESSVGMTLPEFASLMISLGVYQGLNLDGGGSTTMVVDNRTVNSPSDSTGERPVGNCLLLMERRPKAKVEDEQPRNVHRK